MRRITFDLETKNFFSDVGSNDPAELDLSVVCIHDSGTDSFMSFLESDLRKLWPILEQADLLISWNGDHFDIPILNKYYPGDLSKIKSLDLMKEVAKSLGRRFKLDTVAEATLGINKSGHGAEALEWWRNGEIQKLIDYCTDDVRLTKDLYEYAVRTGTLKYKEFGSIKDVKINTSTWDIPESAAMTYTLPF
ncbi:MAG: ribonuclease H-like domain-containing protein [Patescibacteria group bacterium]|nr:ribonuclease H-like domain-containing protein [Patescibacteria group bacterium]MDE2172511.1 ribonuclease H-like domain-containing protein [Patescibacteria group bacterium]